MANLRQTARLAIIVPAELVLVLHVHLDTTAARLPLHKLHAQPHFTAQLALPQAATCVLLASSVQPRPPTPPAHWATTALPVRLPSSRALLARIARPHPQIPPVHRRITAQLVQSPRSRAPLARIARPHPPTSPALQATTALPVRLPSSCAQQARIALHQLLRLHVYLASTVCLALPLPPHVHLDTTVLRFLQIKYPVV